MKPHGTDLGLQAAPWEINAGADLAAVWSLWEPADAGLWADGWGGKGKRDVGPCGTWQGTRLGKPVPWTQRERRWRTVEPWGGDRASAAPLGAPGEAT